MALGVVVSEYYSGCSTCRCSSVLLCLYGDTLFITQPNRANLSQLKDKQLEGSMFFTQAVCSCSLVVLLLVFVEQIREQMLLKYLVGKNG